MRKTCLSLSVVLLSTCSLGAAFAADNRAVDESTLRALAEKAEHASLRDQCFLYAQLVRGSTELANREIASGDTAASALALHSVETYTKALDTALAGDAKKLKDAEILLRESAFKLRAAMLAASIDDRPAMASALSKVNATETKVMAAVFSR